MKTLSEPREVAGHVRRLDSKKFTALPPPVKSTANTRQNGSSGDDSGGNGPDKIGDDNHNDDDGQGNDGNNGDDGSDGEEQVDTNNIDGLSDSDDEFASATSTPWPENTWKEIMESPKEIVPDPKSLSVSFS